MAIASSGCGYRLQTVHGGRFLDPQLRIDLEPFRNLSFDADAGALMAARVREELRRNGFGGRFERGGADYLVEGTVRQVKEDVSSHGSDGFALEHALSLTVDIRVVEVVHGRLVLKEDGVTETAAYFAGPDFQYTESNRRMALEEACRRIARRLGQSLRMVL
ncbi:MAG TPA: LPS assembly lipoprotein LptE [Candidatus Deferrimicrobiaceae bacterium]